MSESDWAGIQALRSFGGFGLAVVAVKNIRSVIEGREREHSRKASTIETGRTYAHIKEGALE